MNYVFICSIKSTKNFKAEPTDFCTHNSLIGENLIIDEAKS